MLFDFLCEAFTKGWVSKNVYVQCVTEPMDATRSLLHELIMHGDVANYMRYLHAIDALYKEDKLVESAYFDMLTQKNKGGYSGIHQSLNAPNVEIARAFLRWFKVNDVGLLKHSRHALLLLKCDKKNEYPTRVFDHDGINDEVHALRVALSLPEQRLSVFVELAKGRGFSSGTVVTSPDDVRIIDVMSPGGM